MMNGFPSLCQGVLYLTLEELKKKSLLRSSKDDGENDYFDDVDDDYDNSDRDHDGNIDDDYDDDE